MVYSLKIISNLCGPEILLICNLSSFECHHCYPDNILILSLNMLISYQEAYNNSHICGDMRTSEVEQTSFCCSAGT
jgi:hypothetical protein